MKRHLIMFIVSRYNISGQRHNDKSRCQEGFVTYQGMKYIQSLTGIYHKAVYK